MNSYIPLDTVRIASPCSASWEGMTGNDRVRHCDDCNLSVYNISEMTREAAEQLVSSAEGRLCIRMYQRADGTIITQDCPVGARKVRARTVRKMRAVAAAALTFIGGAVGVTRAAGVGEIMGKMAPVPTEVQHQDTTAARDTVRSEEPDIIMMGGMMAPVDLLEDAPAEEPVPDEPVEQIYEIMGEMMAIEPVDTTSTTPVSDPVDATPVIGDIPVTSDIIETLPDDQPLPDPVRDAPPVVIPHIR